MAVKPKHRFSIQPAPAFVLRNGFSMQRFGFEPWHAMGEPSLFRHLCPKRDLASAARTVGLRDVTMA